MKSPSRFCLLSLLLLLGIHSARAQGKPPIESNANLKDSTTHVVVERKVIETKKTFQQDTPREGQRKVAIFVENRAEAGLNDKVAVLEDLVASRVAGRGFSVISRDVVVSALKTYRSTDASVSSQSSTPAGDSKASGSVKVAVNSTLPATQLDQALNEATSALRLAQNLGADYILVPSIVTYGTVKKSYTGNGIATLHLVHRLRVSYKLAEAAEGGAIRGGTFTSEKSVRQTADLQTEDGDVLNELLDDAAGQLAEAIAEGGKSLALEVPKSPLVNFSVVCSMADPRHQPITISALGITADNRLVLTNQPLALQAIDVTVELDGVALGSAPGTFQARPGLHKIHLSREGFEAWDRTVNVYEGQILRVALQMSQAGYARWAETTSFLAGLDANRKLTDAEVKRLEGIAEFFRNSHYRVDTKENLRITHRSLF